MKKIIIIVTILIIFAGCIYSKSKFACKDVKAGYKSFMKYCEAGHVNPYKPNAGYFYCKCIFEYTYVFSILGEDCEYIPEKMNWVYETDTVKERCGIWR